MRRLIAVAAIVASAGCSGGTGDGDGSETTVRAEPTVTTSAATTAAPDTDAGCKAALAQTDDVNLPFQACLGEQYDRLLAEFGPGKPERRTACEAFALGPACAGIPVTTVDTTEGP